MKHHLTIPDQPYVNLTACMHMLGTVINAYIPNRDIVDSYVLLKTVFDSPLAKLLGATVGVKCAPLAGQVATSD